MNLQETYLVVINKKGAKVKSVANTFRLKFANDIVCVSDLILLNLHLLLRGSASSNTSTERDVSLS